ncbi:MAG: hypothetical protein CMJ84_06355 [Planctomycetes bacterium]|jgi:hypothetical protein|nr:hypothetical protein [Planctomycetota bacterium]MDP6408302.1 hypothetical protein [Planctomycetota bacterium]
MEDCWWELVAEEVYTFELEQDERQLTMSGFWMEGGGSVCGTSVSLSSGEDEGADWLHEEEWDLEVSADGLAMTGTAEVHHSDDGVSCTVTGTVSAAFIPPALLFTGDGSGPAVMILDDHR